jgi:hypothetical protein
MQVKIAAFPLSALPGRWIYHTSTGEHLEGCFELTEVYPYQHEIAFETDDGGEFFGTSFEPGETFEKVSD